MTASLTLCQVYNAGRRHVETAWHREVAPRMALECQGRYGLFESAAGAGITLPNGSIMWYDTIIAARAAWAGLWSQ